MTIAEVPLQDNHLFSGSVQNQSKNINTYFALTIHEIINKTILIKEKFLTWGIKKLNLAKGNQVCFTFLNI